MVDSELSKKQIKEISDALERVVKDLPWHQSVFLSAMGKKFEQIRDEFNYSVGIAPSNLKNNSSSSEQVSLKDDQVEVYISVYNSQGDDLGNWARIIDNLTRQSVSRPTYLKVNEVKEMIRSKLNLDNEGYVSLHVLKTDLNSMAKESLPKDKLGNSLVLLKERIIEQNKIKKFHHNSGTYEYKKGILSRVGDMNFTQE